MSGLLRGRTVLVDVLGAPRVGGGMNLYASELIAAWADAHPEDRLVVVGGTWITQAWRSKSRIARIVLRDTPTPLRFLGQFLAVPAIARSRRVDAVLSVSPIVSPFVRGRPTACVVHDWRHLRRPEEFSRGQIWYRKLWVHSLRSASTVFAISEKTARETRDVLPSIESKVVPNGRDHPRHWAAVADRPNDPLILTYAQHGNKRPELVLDAFATAHPALPEESTLHVVGARGETRAALESRARLAGFNDHLVLHDHLSDSDYQALIQRASVVVLASSDEGFGLPMVEADYFDVPAVLTNDSGVVDLHPNALVAAPTAASIGSKVSSAILERGSRVASRPHRATWLEAAGSIRSALFEA